MLRGERAQPHLEMEGERCRRCWTSDCRMTPRCARAATAYLTTVDNTPGSSAVALSRGRRVGRSTLAIQIRRCARRARKAGLGAALGSQSAPIGTLPRRRRFERTEYLEPVYGWGPPSVLKYNQYAFRAGRGGWSKSPSAACSASRSWRNSSRRSAYGRKVVGSARFAACPAHTALGSGGRVRT